MIATVLRALEAAGVEFIDDKAVCPAASAGESPQGKNLSK